MFHWFSTKNLVENAGKCPLLTSSKKPADIHISNIEIVSGEKVKLFGVNLKGRLNFDFHVNTLLKKPAKVPRSCKSVQLQEQISRRPSWLVYKDEINLSLDDLQKKDESLSTQQRSLQILVTEIYKFSNDLGPILGSSWQSRHINP